MVQLAKIMLLFGGESSEHSISISSARNVFAALNDTKFDIYLGFIDKSGRWWLLDSLDQVDNIEDAIQLVPVLGTKNFTTIPESIYINPDVILPILHGENGEDGTIQGLARLMHIPTVGCNVASSAICMDKVITKQLLEYNGIKTVPYSVHLFEEPTPDFNQLSQLLGEFLFIKPAGCGSSVGISKVKNGHELTEALKIAHKFDRKVLIERAINARELEVGMLGNGIGARASVVGEVRPDSEFYSFESKYSTNSQTKVIIPADISSELSEKIRGIAKKAFAILGCEGLARVDFFLADDGALYLNEVNTLPGFTNISMYPKLWSAEGLSYTELIEKLVLLAIDFATI